jgi:hypothetical protein
MFFKNILGVWFFFISLFVSLNLSADDNIKFSEIKSNNIFSSCTLKIVSLFAPLKEENPVPKGPREVGVALEKYSQILLSLPYERYRLLEDIPIEIRLNKTKVIDIPGAGSLTVGFPEPVDNIKKRLPLTVKWIDPNGIILIDTKLRARFNRTLLIGTDELTRSINSNFIEGPGIALLFDIQ